MSHSQLEDDFNAERFSGVMSDLNAILAAVLAESGRQDELAAKDKIGGYYTRFRTDIAMPRFTLQIGKIASPEFAGNRFAFSLEKCARLHLHREHLTSWESRDPDNDCYGGAIRGMRDLHGFSGLPEKLDPVVSTLFATYFGDMTSRLAMQILGSADYGKYLPIVTHRQFAQAA